MAAISDLLIEFLTQDLLDRSGSHPIYLSQVEVRGGETFTNNFFKKLLLPLLSRSDYTLKQLIDTVEESNDTLNRTDVFSKVDITLYSDYNSNVKSAAIKNYSKDKPVSTKVLIDLLPITLNIAKGVLDYNNEDLLNVKLDYANNNFNGNAESVKIGVDYIPYNPNDHLRTDLRLLSSLNNPSFRVLIDLFHLHQNNQSWQSTVANSAGGLIGVQYRKGVPHQGYSLESGFSLVKRSLASELDVNDNFVSSVYNKFNYENIKHLSYTKNFPTNGIKIDFTNELSSLAKQDGELPQTDINFVKSNLSLNIYTSFFNNFITFHSNSGFGNIYPLGGAIHISDKFFLGGVHSFKGFSKNALSLTGGLQYAKLTNTIYAKLPSFIHAPSSKNDFNPLRLYLTNTTGDVTNDIFKKGNLGTSFGVGLKYFNEWAHFDIGYYIAQRLGGEKVGVKDGFLFELSLGAASA